MMSEHCHCGPVMTFDMVSLHQILYLYRLLCLLIDTSILIFSLMQVSPQPKTFPSPLIALYLTQLYPVSHMYLYYIYASLLILIGIPYYIIK